MKSAIFPMVVLLGFVSSRASAASVIDSIHGAGAGSFELPNQTITNYATYRAGSTDLTGWTVGSGSVDHVKSNVWMPSNGSYSLDMNGTLASGAPDPGSITTTIGTIVGATYRISFDVSGFIGFSSPANPKELELSVKAVNLLDEAAEISRTNHQFLATNNSNSLPLLLSWESHNVEFTATETRTSISFTSKTTTNQSGILLDNVQVTLVAVPEPSAAFLLGTAAIALAARRSRRIGDSGHQLTR